MGRLPDGVSRTESSRWQAVAAVVDEGVTTAETLAASFGWTPVEAETALLALEELDMVSRDRRDW